MGYGILIGLVVLATFGSLLAGYRLFRESLLTTMIGAMGIWMLLIASPPYLLGWIGLLTPVFVALGSAVLSAVVIAASLFRLDCRRRDFIKRALLSAVKLTGLGILRPWQARSLVLLGPIAVALLAVWVVFISYYAPSCSWDGLWYHESIVGFSIQNQGFDWIDAPRRMELVNGYPRMSETFYLFPALFTGKVFLDTIPPFMMIIAFTTMVGLVRPVCSSSVHALGWASVLALLPAVVFQLRSTLTDVSFLAGFLVALYFMTRPRLRISDILLGTLLTGMMGAMKGTGAVIAPVLFAIGAIRLIRHAMATHTPKVISALIASILAASLLFLPTYVRNWVKQDNPIWPLKVETAGISLKGVHRLRMHRSSALYDLFSPPRPMQLEDTRDNGYGNMPPFLIPPLVLIGLVSLLRKVRRRRHDPAIVTILWCLGAVIPSLLLSPAGFWWARLNLHTVAVLLLLSAWTVGHVNREKLAEGILSTLVVGALLTLVWSQPSWQTPPKVLVKLAERSPSRRQCARLWGTMPHKNIAQDREKEIKEGDVVVYDGTYRFVAGLWNMHFSNRVVYLPAKKNLDDYLKKLDELNAEWVVVKMKSALDKTLKKRKQEWEPVGELDKKTRAYRRQS